MKIIKIGLKNFKNIKDSEIVFNSNTSGIYGHNGTGKTAVIEAIDILKTYFNVNKSKNTSSQLKERVLNSIKIGENTTEISIVFENTDFQYNIIVAFNKNINNEIYVSKEQLYYKENKPRKRFKQLGLLQNDKYTIIPEMYLSTSKEISKIPNSFIRKDLILSFNNLNSYFSEILKYVGDEDVSKFYKELELFLIHFKIINKAIKKIMVVTLRERVIYNIPEKNRNIYPESIANLLEETTNGIANIFQFLIPNSKIILEKEIVAIREERKIRIRPFFKKNGRKIPLERESTGIIKLFSILPALIHYTRDKNAIVLIDEIDTHIFGCLLAVLLEVFSENAKGQLIFTGHNLLPLERLNKNSIIISSKIKENVTYSYLKGTNLRQKYLKSQSMWSEANIEPLLINVPALKLYIKGEEL